MGIYQPIQKMGGVIIKKGLNSELEVIGQSSYIICDVGSPSCWCQVNMVHEIGCQW